MDIILVTENKQIWKGIVDDYEIVTPTEYLQGARFISPDYRVVNLSKNYNYQSAGYYVSLLAQARGHKVYPSIMTVLDSKNTEIISRLNDAIAENIDGLLKPIKSDHFEISVYFGQNMASRYAGLCHQLYCEFPHPLFRVYMEKKAHWKITKVRVLTINNIQESHYDFIKEALKRYCGKRYQRGSSRKKYYYDVAILHNENEEKPPSNPEALKKFIKAGDEVGLRVELITKEDFKILGEYDGLFIRETTAVNHHTYRFARRAVSEKMFAIDDPESILKCSNKVYMAEYLQSQNIDGPRTTILNRDNYLQFSKEPSFPCVLKKPDGAFSMGVKKVSSQDEYMAIVDDYFKDSDLLIAQEFMPSDYDWRIGVLGNQVIYACRYYMAEGHWQIINWDTNQDGDSDSVPVSDIPPIVKKTALKATRGIGNGLYGVDIKMVNGKAYVIEINDNPNIDAGVEDVVLGDKLYLQIMNFFLSNLNKMHGHEK